MHSATNIFQIFLLGRSLLFFLRFLVLLLLACQWFSQILPIPFAILGLLCELSLQDLWQWLSLLVVVEWKPQCLSEMRLSKGSCNKFIGKRDNLEFPKVKYFSHSFTDSFASTLFKIVLYEEASTNKLSNVCSS